jgi:hypothetical protein
MRQAANLYSEIVGSVINTLFSQFSKVLSIFIFDKTLQKSKASGSFIRIQITGKIYWEIMETGGTRCPTS